MWFAWLLRTDVRGESEISDEHAQRRFIGWWLAFGDREYPHVWSYNEEHARIALSEIYLLSGAPLPCLLHIIWNSREDLKLAYPLDNVDGYVKFLCWYRIYGPLEYRGAISLPPKYLAKTEIICARFPWKASSSVPEVAAALWSAHPELQRHFNVFDPLRQNTFSLWYRDIGNSHIPCPAPSQVDVKPTTSVNHSASMVPFGVNLIGFSRAEFGLGEDVRLVSYALEQARVPHIIIDVGTPACVSGNDKSRSQWESSRLLYPITIHCMSAFDSCGNFLVRGMDLFEGRYNIGYWPWELPSFPKEWRAAAELVDEIWASTKFQQRSYQKSVDCPVFLMPPAVRCVAKRSRLRKKKREFTFLYPFDPRSFLQRKNPVALVLAFRRAFPQRRDHSVRLLLRVNGELRVAPGWRCLVNAIRGDKRIVVIEGTVNREDAMNFMIHADCLVSTHRSEGFGRNLAEALTLGVPVIGNWYSGPADFLERSERLHFRTKLVGAYDYPFGKGQFWSEPSMMHLIRLLRRRRIHTPSSYARKSRAKRFLVRYSDPSAGRRYADRLFEIIARFRRRHQKPD